MILHLHAQPDRLGVTSFAVDLFSFSGKLNLNNSTSLFAKDIKKITAFITAPTKFFSRITAPCYFLFFLNDGTYDFFYIIINFT